MGSRFIRADICCHVFGRTAASLNSIRSSSREVRIRVPTFFCFVYFTRGTLPPKKVGTRALLVGDLEPDQLSDQNLRASITAQASNTESVSSSSTWQRALRINKLCSSQKLLRPTFSVAKAKALPANMNRCRVPQSTASESSAEVAMCPSACPRFPPSAAQSFCGPFLTPGPNCFSPASLYL